MSSAPDSVDCTTHLARTSTVTRQHRHPPPRCKSTVNLSGRSCRAKENDAENAHPSKLQRNDYPEAASLTGFTEESQVRAMSPPTTLNVAYIDDDCTMRSRTRRDRRVCKRPARLIGRANCSAAASHLQTVHSVPSPAVSGLKFTRLHSNRPNLELTLTLCSLLPWPALISGRRMQQCHCRSPAACSLESRSLTRRMQPNETRIRRNTGCQALRALQGRFAKVSAHLPLRSILQPVMLLPAGSDRPLLTNEVESRRIRGQMVSSVAFVSEYVQWTKRRAPSR